VVKTAESPAGVGRLIDIANRRNSTGGTTDGLDANHMYVAKIVATTPGCDGEDLIFKKDVNDPSSPDVYVYKIQILERLGKSNLGTEVLYTFLDDSELGELDNVTTEFGTITKQGLETLSYNLLPEGVFVHDGIFELPKVGDEVNAVSDPGIQARYILTSRGGKMAQELQAKINKLDNVEAIAKAAAKEELDAAAAKLEKENGEKIEKVDPNSEDEKYDYFKKEIENSGVAGSTFYSENGRLNIIAYRIYTPSPVNDSGNYNDRFACVWLDMSGKKRVKEFAGNTEPAGIYLNHEDSNRKKRGASVVGSQGLGRIPANSFRNYYIGTSAKGKAADNHLLLRPKTKIDAERDKHTKDGNFNNEIPMTTYPDGRRNATEGTMHIHSGGNTSSYSMGCQTLHPTVWRAFFDDVLGKPTTGNRISVGYTLLNAPSSYPEGIFVASNLVGGTSLATSSQHSGR